MPIHPAKRPHHQVIPQSVLGLLIRPPQRVLQRQRSPRLASGFFAGLHQISQRGSRLPVETTLPRPVLPTSWTSSFPRRRPPTDPLDPTNLCPRGSSPCYPRGDPQIAPFGTKTALRDNLPAGNYPPWLLGADTRSLAAEYRLCGTHPSRRICRRDHPL